MQTFKTTFTQNGALGFYNWENGVKVHTQNGALGFYNWENGVKVRPWENAHERKKSILLGMNPLDIYWQIIHVKDIIPAK